MPVIECPYCNRQHGDRELCPPAKRVLDALLARGQRFDMPTVEFGEPVGGADMLGEGTVLVRQFVVQAALVDVAGVPAPTLIFGGQDAAGGVLPHWLYPASPRDLRRAAALVTEMTEMAIRRAAT